MTLKRVLIVMVLVGALLPFLQRPVFSGELAFIGNREMDVLTFDLDAGILRNLTSNYSYEGEYVWSPDGQRIAFTSNRDFNMDIFVMDSDRRNLRQLTHSDTDNLNPVWSPDGSTLAYVFDVTYQDANEDLYIVNVETGERRQMTDDPAEDDLPVWSPDGKTVAFRSNRIQPPDTMLSPKDEIYLLDVESGEETLLAEAMGDIEALAWSPDGLTLAFNTFNSDLFLVSLADHNMSRLAAKASAPVWSPDGERILMVSAQDGDTEICVIKPDGSDFTCLTDNQRPDYQARWSPDGSMIAFIGIISTQHQVTIRYSGSNTYTLDTPHIFVMDADGTNQRQILSGGYANLTWRP